MKSPRVTEIDLLRFIAAMSVVFFHYAFRGSAADSLSRFSYPVLVPASKYGFLGVQLFFMISGFVILMTASNGSTLSNFLVSRFTRLYPAFWICCTLTFLVVIGFGAPTHTATLSQFFVNLSMLAGFVGIPSIDGAYWSLYVEIRFYALIALLLVFRKIHFIQYFLASWLGLSIFQEVVPITILRKLFITDFSVYFIGGAVCYLIYSKGATLGRYALVATSFALAQIQARAASLAFDRYYQVTSSPMVTFLIITLIFGAMMLVAHKQTGFIGRGNYVILGSITYPLYLLHQNIGYILFNLAFDKFNVHILFWGMIFFMVFLAYFVYRYIESPTSSYLRRRLKNSGRQFPQSQRAGR